MPQRVVPHLQARKVLAVLPQRGAAGPPGDPCAADDGDWHPKQAIIDGPFRRLLPRRDIPTDLARRPEAGPSPSTADPEQTEAMRLPRCPCMTSLTRVLGGGSFRRRDDYGAVSDEPQFSFVVLLVAPAVFAWLLRSWGEDDVPVGAHRWAER